jgi:hypothetical protein
LSNGWPWFGSPPTNNYFATSGIRSPSKYPKEPFRWASDNPAANAVDVGVVPIAVASDTVIPAFASQSSVVTIATGVSNSIVSTIQSLGPVSTVGLDTQYDNLIFPDATDTSSFPESTIPASVLSDLGITALAGPNATLSASLGLSTSTSSSAPSSLPSIDCTNPVNQIPGQCGVAGCAYYLASDGGICSTDFCDCGGIAAPLLTSTISGSVTTDCRYTTQPTANLCPPSTSIISNFSPPPSQTPTTTTSSPLASPSSNSCIPCPTPGASTAQAADCPANYPDWFNDNGYVGPCACLFNTNDYSPQGCALAVS